MDQTEFATKLQTIAIAHRESGDPNNLADALRQFLKYSENIVVWSGIAISILKSLNRVQNDGRDRHYRTEAH